MVNNLKSIREQKGMTLEGVAELVGISTSYLCHLERGSRKNPSLKVSSKIAKTLNVAIEDVFEN